MRLLGEWKALKDLGRTVRYAAKVTVKDCMRIWRDWLEERPYLKCVECGQWGPNIAVLESGRCFSCDCRDDNRCEYDEPPEGWNPNQMELPF